MSLRSKSWCKKTQDFEEPQIKLNAPVHNDEIATCNYTLYKYATTTTMIIVQNIYRQYIHIVQLSLIELESNLTIIPNLGNFSYNNICKSMV